MKYLFAAVLALGTVASFSAAEAAGGCGPGWHRGPYGGCVANRGVVVVQRPPVVVVRPVRGLERAVDLAGHAAIGRVVGFDDHGILCRRHRAGIGKGRRRRQCGSGDQQYPDRTTHRLSPETDRDAHQNRNGQGWQTLSLSPQYWGHRFSGLTNSGGASSDGASPNGGGANPSACDASPSAGGPSRDDGHGPSALLPA